ncbi:MAG: DUF2169 domain-containing protein [Polyangiaceae bacterium]|nr:DUF2169 domain-containing protein [Polyangiaceae bacterium]
MTTLTAPSPTVRQLSLAIDPANFALSVVVKRTYSVADDGHCVVAGEQAPLSEDIEESPSDPHLVEQDLDLIPFKPRTDVVVAGHAYADGKAGTIAAVTVQGKRKEILVVGDRRATLSATGGVVISRAEPFEKMPVSFARAYGGRDRVAEAKYGNPFALLGKYLEGSPINVDLQSPFLYPKNPCGKGYLVELARDAVEACALPNLEDPRDPLTPDRLVVGDPDRWIYMPIPQSLGWVSLGWYPRLAFGGVIPDYEAADRPIPEVERGLLPKEVLRAPESEADAPPREITSRVANGAPLDLQFPYLDADEAIELQNLHPRRKKWIVRLPGEKPKIWTDGRNGKLNATSPVMHSVMLEPDQGRVTVVWRGSAPAIRPYFDDELLSMPLRVEW